MTLLAPWWLALGVAPLVVWWWRRGGRATRQTIASATLVEGLPATWRTRLRLLPRTLRWLACALLAVALAQPVLLGTRAVARQPGLDVMLLIDVSQSMMALDGLPDRLGTARAIAEQLVRRRPFDRFGIVLFAGEDTLASPVTSDLRAVLDRLRSIEAVEGTGTALGPALLGAVERMSAREPGALIVLSDGASNTGAVTPGDAARRIAEGRVRVITVGIGRNGTARFPTAFGLIDVPVVIDEAGLQRVASAGRGVYVPADDVARAAGAVTRSLDQIAPVARPVVQNLALPLAPWLGVAAMVLVAAEMAVALFVLRATSW